MAQLKHSQLERLVHYYHVLEDLPRAEYFSSSYLAERLGIDDTQIRRDFAAVGVRGYPRKGFFKEEVLATIQKTLGFDLSYPAVLIGVGHLGGALAAYNAFSRYGLRLVGLFDQSPEQIGKRFGRLVVQPIKNLNSIINNRDVKLGIIAVPASVAQDVALALVDSGIETIWNFAPTTLELPPHVFVRNEHISVGLGELAYVLKTK